MGSSDRLLINVQATAAEVVEDLRLCERSCFRMLLRPEVGVR